MKKFVDSSGGTIADPGALTQAIKQRARAIGFDLIGVARAKALKPERGQLLEWLSLGYHADMKWMARDPETRVDPRKLFPQARSVLVVALNYYTPHQHSENSQTGKVSRYAWGDDYHEVVGSKLRSLLAWIKEQVPDVDGKICVDIQPLMDKAWGVRAGLGWIGKHSNLITQRFGSWVFIGELLLNIDLDYDTERVEDHCGTCTLCIDACPTAAITEPYVVDSNKCISYATIESRAPEMPDELAGKLDGWLYGCDICQDVCPWNRFEETTTEPRFNPRRGNINASLSEFEDLTPETYAERFRGSAMKRAKLAGLKRNARALMKHRESVNTGSDSDRVSTESDSDRVSTGSDSDRVSTGTDSDRVSTGSDSDRVSTGSDSDRVSTGSDSDLVSTGSDSDRVSTGTDSDRVSTGSDSDRVSNARTISRQTK